MRDFYVSISQQGQPREIFTGVTGWMVNNSGVSSLEDQAEVAASVRFASAALMAKPVNLSPFRANT
jgi:hypothetical protein